MKSVAIILAAGRGTRMGLEVPKQYADLLGKPVISYSLLAFEKSRVSEIIVVTGADNIEYIRREFIEKYNIGKCSKIVEGGKERFDSVVCGVKACDSDTNYVLIHDSARPMVRPVQIDGMLDYLEKVHPAVIAGTPSTDTIKATDGEGRILLTPDRSRLWNAQTPQGFEYSMFMHACEKAGSSPTATQSFSAGTSHITDDASVVELMTDVKVHLMDFGRGNIKITTPEDLMLAEIILKHTGCDR